MKPTRRRLLQGMAACAAAWAAPARSHFDHTASGTGAQPAAPRPLATSAAFDAQGRLWAAQVEYVEGNGTAPRAANIVLAWSADRGKTWARTGPVLRTPEAVEANGEGRPKLAFGPGGQVYISYTSPLDRPHTGNIRFTRSTDGGVSFSEPATIQRDRAITGHRFDSLLVDGRGRIFIAWIDKRDGNAAKAAGAAYRGAALYYTVSSDDGATFMPDIRIADHCCECCRIALALDGNGEVVAMWRHIFAPNVRDHAMAVLHASGRPGPVVRNTFEDWRIDACPHHGPSLAFDGKGRRHQVWFSAGTEDGGVYYAAAARGGALAKPVRLGGMRAEHGEVAASGMLVAVAWKEFDGQASRAIARVSNDGGRHWRERMLASTKGASDHPHLARQGDTISLVWHTEQDGIIVRNVEA
jgi:hypothetical protein